MTHILRLLTFPVVFNKTLRVSKAGQIFKTGQIFKARQIFKTEKIFKPVQVYQVGAGGPVESNQTV